MTEYPQHPIDPQAKSPFSPLQTGCAFVMLTNMLIYLGVVLFTFNLLDPSNIDASYLAKRGFTARPEPKSEQDAAFLKLSQEKREEQQQVQTEMISVSKQLEKKESPATKLSRIEQRKLATSLPEEPEKPTAARTVSATSSGSTLTRSPSTRPHSTAIYPQAIAAQPYTLFQTPAPPTIAPEIFVTIPVELAIGISTPLFTLSSSDPAAPYLYRPANPIPNVSRGNLKLDSPSIGAESLATNTLKKANGTPLYKETAPPSAKDQL
jgi:hypothetical protein